MDAFKIKKGGKVLDYRQSLALDLDSVRYDFSKKYKVLSVRQPGRHVIIEIDKNGQEYIIKLASTEGIGARTEGEKLWNEEFNKYSKTEEFRVPKNLEDGYYNGLYYLVTEKFKGDHLSTLRGENNMIDEFIDRIIAFSEHIQNLPLNIESRDLIEHNNAQGWFVEKTQNWLKTLSPDVIDEYRVNKLMEMVKEGSSKLLEKPRHGDFTPWHMIALKDGLGLIDGEHAHSHGVEYYDIAYFIQRVFSVINRKDQAVTIVEKLLSNGKSNINKLKIVLLSRAIGGFCDEFLSPVPNFKKAQEFADFVQKLS